MKRDTFDWIWVQIERSINAIEDAIPAEEKEQFHFCRFYGERTAGVIWEEYLSQRDNFKSWYYKGSPNKDNLMDQHKIAACFCKALLRKKVFTFDLNDTIPEKILLSNYTLAYSASLSVIYLCLLDWYLYKEKQDIVNRIIQLGTLEAPPTTASHPSYHYGRIKALAVNDFYGCDFDILSYADMMFWIEHYNRQLLENNFVVEPYDEEYLQINRLS